MNDGVGTKPDASLQTHNEPKLIKLHLRPVLNASSSSLEATANHVTQWGLRFAPTRDGMGDQSSFCRHIGTIVTLKIPLHYNYRGAAIR